MATTVTDKECVEYARKCVRLACLPANQAVKDQLLKIACRWMETATPRPSGRPLSP